MLKNVLSLLLSKFYSKKESEAVGHQAMPSSNATAITPTKTETAEWTTVHNGVAPFDGYLYANCISTASDGCFQTSSAQLAFVTFAPPNGAIRHVLPFAKGQPIYLSGKAIKQISLMFVKTIWGGYQALKNALLQGGGLCLNSLSSSLRRSSWLARRSGWRSSQPHPVLMFWLLRKRQMVDTEHLPSPHSTDFVLSDNTSGVRTLQILSAALRIKQTPLEWAQWLTLTILWEDFTALSRSRKETKSKVESFKGRLTNSLSLRPLGKRSSAVGGASC